MSIDTTSTWSQQLELIKHFWTSRFEECENDIQRQSVRKNFAEALATFYGSKPADDDIINEVNLELEKW